MIKMKQRPDSGELYVVETQPRAYFSRDYYQHLVDTINEVRAKEGRPQADLQLTFDRQHEIWVIKSNIRVGVSHEAGRHPGETARRGRDRALSREARGYTVSA